MKKYFPFITTVIAAILCLSTMAIYMQKILGGNINFHFLPAEMFGVPEALKLKEIEPIFTGKKNTGWDRMDSFITICLMLY